MRAVSAYLMHLTQEDIQTERDEIISATQEDIRNLADLLSAVLSQENICVILETYCTFEASIKPSFLRMQVISAFGRIAFTDGSFSQNACNVTIIFG